MKQHGVGHARHETLDLPGVKKTAGRIVGRRHADHPATGRYGGQQRVDIRTAVGSDRHGMHLDVEEAGDLAVGRETRVGHDHLGAMRTGNQRQEMQQLIRAARDNDAIGRNAGIGCQRIEQTLAVGLGIAVEPCCRVGDRRDNPWCRRKRTFVEMQPSDDGSLGLLSGATSHWDRPNCWVTGRGCHRRCSPRAPARCGWHRRNRQQPG